MHLYSRKEFLKEGLKLDSFYDNITNANDYNCSNKGLISLEGGPVEVNDSVECYNNKLISLKGAPLKISGYFDCSNNPDLSNIDDMPEVGGDLYIKECPLVTDEMIEKIKHKIKGKIHR